MEKLSHYSGEFLVLSETEVVVVNRDRPHYDDTAALLEACVTDSGAGAFFVVLVFLRNCFRTCLLVLLHLCFT